MEHKPQNVATEGTIDFDDEYSEDDKYLNNIIQAPLEVPQPKINLLQEKDEIQINPEEEITDEENIIYDPKVKELNELDINNKQAIIDILMDEDLIEKKPVKTAEFLKEKNKNKFPNVKSNLNYHTIGGINEQEKKNTYYRFGFQIETTEGDPEFIKDINVAADKLKEQIKEENQDIAKLLFDDLEKKNNKKILTRKDIGEKVQKALNKKKEDIEKIEAKIYIKQKSQETFAPMINHRKKDGSKRDLNTFLKSQNDFQKKVEKKKLEILQKNESEIKELNKYKPQLTKNTEELIKKKYGTERTEPIYLRLYNKMIKNDEKLKQAEEKIILREKEEEQKYKEQENELKKINPYKHIKARVNLSQKNFKEKKENKALKRVRSAENIKSNNELNNENITNKKTLLDYKFIQLNKVLYNKFLSNFDDVLKLLSENNKKNENNILEDLDEHMYFKLLFYLGMVTYPKEKSGLSEKDIDLNGENLLNLREKKLVQNSFKVLNILGNTIKVSDAKNFLICVLGLQNFNLYQMYKSRHEQDLKDQFPLYKYKKEEIPELILTKQNRELISKIDKNNKSNKKYFSISKDNEIIFTLEKSFIINRDFNKLAVNYRSQKKKDKEEKLKNLIKKECPFKPEIGEKSNELYKKHKDKFNAILKENDINIIKSKMKKSNLEYVDRIFLLERKRLYENQKIREEMEQKKIKECTFKPKILNYYTNKDINTKRRKDEKNVFQGSCQIIQKINKTKINKEKNVFDVLYEDGKKKFKLKKDKTKEEIELEKQRKEYTFQPNIEDLDPKSIPKTNFNNDIYNEKEYKLRYERLKYGRLQRMVRNNKNNRLGLNDELKKFVRDEKEFNYIQNNQYFETDDPFYYNTLEINNVKSRLNTQMEKNEKEIADKIYKSQEIIQKKNNIIERKRNYISNKENNFEKNNYIIPQKISSETKSIERKNYSPLEQKIIEKRNIYPVEEKIIEKKSISSLEQNNMIKRNIPSLELNGNEKRDVPPLVQNKIEKRDVSPLVQNKIEKNDVSPLVQNKIEKSDESPLIQNKIENNPLVQNKIENKDVPPLVQNKIENKDTTSLEQKKFENKIIPTIEQNNNEKGNIPLLIIDVNIGQGIKRKIYVYEGDTSETLAEKFAKEYKLEPDVKNKLRSLIQSHMERLLTKTVEENIPNQRKYKNVYRIKSK